MKPRADSFRRPSATSPMIKRQKILISNIRNGKGDYYQKKIKRSIKEYYDQLYPHKLDSLEK